MPAKKKAPRPAASPQPPDSTRPRTPARRKAIDATPEQPGKSRPRKPAAPRATAPKAPRTRKPESPAAVARVGPASDVLSVVIVAPEAHPFAKTGGLAEVAGALPAALARLGHTVTLILPRYRGIHPAGAGAGSATLQLGNRPQEVRFLEQRLEDRVTAVFVDVPELFDREGLYGAGVTDYPDNAWRFAVFCRAALEHIRLTGKRPSVIHAHDWQTGLLPVYQKMQLSADPTVGGVPVVFTIHNLAFQGLFPASVLPLIGLGWEVLHVQAMEYWGQISYLKAGINFSEKITTVSRTYAREILRPELGFGFDGVLARRVDDLVGILNAIDTDRWSPSADPFVPVRFDAANLEGKRDAKRALLELVGLAADEAALDRPLIGLISRLTDQKGFDLVAAAAEELMALQAGWVMLGSGETRYEELWRSLAGRYPDRVSATIGFDERLAHAIEAGADFFLMPSRFEPCGLNQIYSLRYGTIPIVRATGGLEDTVEDVDETTGAGTGFKFREYSPRALRAAVERALAVYRRPEVRRRIQQAGMRQDHSWDVAAREYVKVYGVAGGPRRAR